MGQIGRVKLNSDTQCNFEGFASEYNILKFPKFEVLNSRPKAASINMLSPSLPSHAGGLAHYAVLYRPGNSGYGSMPDPVESFSHSKPSFCPFFLSEFFLSHFTLHSHILVKVVPSSWMFSSIL